MALTPSTMKLGLGAPAPDFRLPDANRKIHALEDFQGAKALVIVFACNHCPFVVHVREAIASVADDYAGKGVRFVAINSNDLEKYPDDRPEKMIPFAAESGWKFPYLIDDTQSVAKAYKAACTPDFFVFDANGMLTYRGQMDAARPGNDKANDGADLRRALDDALAGKSTPEPHIPSAGCNIKWKPGNEPTYFG